MLLLVPVILTLAACSKTEPVSAASGHNHAGHKHEHHAPHGGTAVVLGDEQYHLEFVRDAASGTLTAFVLDGEMEAFIRIEASMIELAVTVGGQSHALSLAAVANTTTGETVGDTSEFTVTADWLKTTSEFDAVIKRIVVRGVVFEQVAFNFPKGNE